MRVEESGYKPIWQPFVDKSLELVDALQKKAKELEPFAIGGILDGTVAGAYGIFLLWRQARVISKAQQLQGMLAVFSSFETPEVIRARAYMRTLPENPESIGDIELENHIREMRPALIAFDRVGYLVAGGYVEREPIVASFWDGVWERG